jgi:hypothetical protein
MECRDRGRGGGADVGVVVFQKSLESVEAFKGGARSKGACNHCSSLRVRIVRVVHDHGPVARVRE